MTEDKPILKWALLRTDGGLDELFDTREVARYHRRYYRNPQLSVVRVQITVLKDRK